MLKQQLFFLLFLMAVASYGQIGSSSKRNSISEKRIAVKQPPSITKNLAQRITKNCSTDSEKVKAIFTWITANIGYDHELHNNPQLQKKIYTSEANVIKNALERNKALCGGYAFLFRELCREVGIASEAIHGYSKKYYTKPKKDPAVDHTWNAVMLDGKWQLLDITWARSHGRATETGNFWYLTRPEDFIYSHYPEDPKWTLLRHPISKDEFHNAGVR